MKLSAETEILPLLGSKEGILYVSLAFVNPGETILVPDPGYPAYSSVAKIVGAHLETYPLREKNNAGSRAVKDRIKSKIPDDRMDRAFVDLVGVCAPK